MAGIECRDIFNAVYINVKGSYISNLYSTKMKTMFSSTSQDDEENLQMTKSVDPVGETNINIKERLNAHDETVSEFIDREDESKVADKIRADVDEKFPFALASVCSNLAYLDREYRKMKGYDEQPEFSEFIIEVSDYFPLSDRFAFPAIMYLSSMMLIDIDEKRSDDFYDKYALSVSKICSELPFETKSTVEKYPY
jgi:hypothetical protein